MQTTGYELPRPPRRLGPSVPIAHCMPLGLGLKQRVITSGSSPWTPNSLGSKVHAWYNASLGGSASSATDQSSNGQNLAGGTANPTYTSGGSGASWWDFSCNTNAQLIGGSFTLTQPFMVTAVGWANSSTAGNSYLYDFASGNTCTAIMLGGGLVLDLDAGSVACGVTLTAAQWFVSEAIFNGASSSQSLNGGTAVTGNPGTNNPTSGGHFSMGNFFGGGNFWIGRVGEIYITDVLTAGDLTSSRAYLLAEWGVS